MLLSIHDDPTQAAIFQMEDLNAEISSLPKPELFFPDDFEDLMGDIAAAKAATIPERKVRVTLLAKIKAGLAEGVINPLEFTSAANFSYNRHTDAILKLAIGQDVEALKAYEVKGVNTYAKAIKAYRDLLIEHVEKKLAFERSVMATLKKQAAASKAKAKVAAKKKAV